MMCPARHTLLYSKALGRWHWPYTRRLSAPLPLLQSTRDGHVVAYLAPGLSPWAVEVPLLRWRFGALRGGTLGHSKTIHVRTFAAWDPKGPPGGSTWGPGLVQKASPGPSPAGRTLFHRSLRASAAALPRGRGNPLRAMYTPRAGPAARTGGLRGGAHRDHISSEANLFQTICLYRS